MLIKIMIAAGVLVGVVLFLPQITDLASVRMDSLGEDLLEVREDAAEMVTDGIDLATERIGEMRERSDALIQNITD